MVNRRSGPPRSRLLVVLGALVVTVLGGSFLLRFGREASPAGARPVQADPTPIEPARNFATYNPQAAREDMLELGRHGESRGGILAPVRQGQIDILCPQQRGPRGSPTEAPQGLERICPR